MDNRWLPEDWVQQVKKVRWEYTLNLKDASEIVREYYREVADAEQA